MAEKYLLPTPEAVDVAYDLAGIGTRFIAVLLDGVLQLLSLAVIGAAAAALWGLGNIGRTVALIAGLTLSFLVVWGYFITLETVWRGQTPGKRALNLRVVRVNGYPIGFAEAFVRNVVRIVDFLPVAYGVGVLTMFISPQSRRLGDFAAGTVVIKERAGISLPAMTAAARQAEKRLRSAPEPGSLDPEEFNWNLGSLSAEDLRLMRDYLDRLPDLTAEARARLGNEIATHVAGRIGARHPLDAAQFINRVLALHAREQI